MHGTGNVWKGSEVMKAVYRVRLLSEYFDFEFAGHAADFLAMAVHHAEDKELAECYRIEVCMKDGEADDETE